MSNTEHMETKNKILDSIFDEIAVGSAQGLIRKDLVLEQNEAIEKVCSNDKSHTAKLEEN